MKVKIVSYLQKYKYYKRINEIIRNLKRLRNKLIRKGTFERSFFNKKKFIERCIIFHTFTYNVVKGGNNNENYNKRKF